VESNQKLTMSWKGGIPVHIAEANKNWPELKAGTFVEK
jgi:hypothetical protein